MFNILCGEEEENKKSCPSLSNSVRKKWNSCIYLFGCEINNW